MLIYMNDYYKILKYENTKCNYNSKMFLNFKEYVHAFGIMNRINYYHSLTVDTNNIHKCFMKSVSINKAITWDVIKYFPNYYWDFDELIYNANFNSSIITENPQFPWLFSIPLDDVKILIDNIKLKKHGNEEWGENIGYFLRNKIHFTFYGTYTVDISASNALTNYDGIDIMSDIRYFRAIQSVKKTRAKQVIRKYYCEYKFNPEYKLCKKWLIKKNCELQMFVK